jgi:hypothetical protein
MCCSSDHSEYLPQPSSTLMIRATKRLYTLDLPIQSCNSEAACRIEKSVWQIYQCASQGSTSHHLGGRVQNTSDDTPSDSITDCCSQRSNGSDQSSGGDKDSCTDAARDANAYRKNEFLEFIVDGFYIDFPASCGLPSTRSRCSL